LGKLAVGSKKKLVSDTPVRHLPLWVKAPMQTEGSIDPLGYSIESDAIATLLLPGVTVQTRRARYLSFFCWAVQKCGNDQRAIDRWEIALSVGEHLRHGKDTSCPFFGSGILNERQYPLNEALPRQLHVQTARLLYSGFARSCGLIQDSKGLSSTGAKLAKSFAQRVPGSLPKTISKCEGMPCLSEIGANEAKYLYRALFEDTKEGEARLATYKAVGKTGWRLVRKAGRRELLKQYLAPPSAGDDSAALLHKAAILELEALPLTRLFLELYNDRTFTGVIPSKARFNAFAIGTTRNGLLSDLAAHLRKAKSLGRDISDELKDPLTFSRVKAYILQKHREVAKPDDPWVSDNWEQRRRGLMPSQPPDLHLYRLEAFSSLLADIGEI
jgi:hypothetical protein